MIKLWLRTYATYSKNVEGFALRDIKGIFFKTWKKCNCLWLLKTLNFKGLPGIRLKGARFISYWFVKENARICGEVTKFKLQKLNWLNFSKPFQRLSFQLHSFSIRKCCVENLNLYFQFSPKLQTLNNIVLRDVFCYDWI